MTDRLARSSTEVPMRLIGLAVVLTLSLVLSPLAVDAQQPGKVYPRRYLDQQGLGPGGIDGTKAQLTEQPLFARPPSRTIGPRQRPVLAFRPQLQAKKPSPPQNFSRGRIPNSLQNVFA
jgi:hypothetical protein